MSAAMSLSESPTGDMRDRLIIALDVPSVEDARALVRRIGDAGRFYKVGYQLAYGGGLNFVQELADQDKKVFLDLKLHDIANTVEEGVRSAAGLGASLLTVHAYPQTMRAAVAGREGSALRILAVTVLTSYDDADLAEAGYGTTVASLVARRTAQACDLGVDGIVCAATEAEQVRGLLGPDRLVVTPGIRPADAAAGDQKRIVTPRLALRSGASHLVVGRPITGAADPRGAAEAIAEDMSSAFQA